MRANAMIRYFLVLITMLLSQGAVWAQCAMCRSTLETNMSNGETAGLAAGLNLGILYLFATPYVLFGVIAFLWYKNSKTNGKKVSDSGSRRG